MICESNVNLPKMIQRAERDGYVFYESYNGKSVRKGANKALGNSMVVQVEIGFLINLTPKKRRWAMTSVKVVPSKVL